MTKKGTIIFIFLNLFCFPAIAQSSQNLNAKDELGRKQGFWRSFDEMGHLKYEGSFKDDIPFDTFKYYYPDGKLKAVSFISDEGEHSQTKLYHRNGKVMAEGNYLKKKKDGKWQYFSEYDGALLSEENYKNELKEGWWRKYYPNKQLAEELKFVNNKEEGSWVQYYTDGVLKLKGNYSHGEKEGDFVMYHSNRKVEAKGNYSHSLKNGIWNYYSEEGKQVKEEVFKNGKLISSQEF
jgi:antitoxin component YwqK of YwqJK toxin-antitoxin module